MQRCCKLRLPPKRLVLRASPFSTRLQSMGRMLREPTVRWLPCERVGPAAAVSSVSSLVALALTACGPDVGTSGDAARTEVGYGSWQLVERQYPFTGEAGETVCAEWRYEPSVGGVHRIERDSYDFRRMNELLAWSLRDANLFHEQSDREAADLRAALAAVRTSGISEVRTCDDARAFAQRKTEYFEAMPSNPSRPGQAAKPRRIAPVPMPDGRAPQELTEKVAHSYTQQWLSTVRVQNWIAPNSGMSCSGTLIDQNHLLTAAHCFASTGWKFVSVDYGDTVSGCLSVFSCGSRPPQANAYVWRHPSFVGGILATDPADDVAVLMTIDPWPAPANTSAAWSRFIATDVLKGDWHWLIGYGETGHTTNNVGTGRIGSWVQGVEWSGTYHWLNKGIDGVSRMCVGDSGGTALNQDLIGMNLLLGVASNKTGGSANCPYTGDKYRFTALEHKAAWIAGIAGCWDSTVNGIWYKGCW